MALCREWQDFLGRRIAEGFALVQRLGTARSPEQVRAAYVAFWQKAANDYSQECGSPVKLAGVLTNPRHHQYAGREAQRGILPLAKAA